MRLKEYVDKNHINVSKWARGLGISRVLAYKICSGYSPSYATATLIVNATNGNVGYSDLGDNNRYKRYLKNGNSPL